MAAITIPIINSQNEKRQLYTQFRATYTTISNALNLAMIDHGDPEKWKLHIDGNNDYLKTYVIPYLKTADTSKRLAEYEVPNYKNLAGGSMSTLVNGAVSLNPLTVKLPSGALLFQLNEAITVDVNGLKGPNVFGRDIFIIMLTTPSFCSGSGKPICVVDPPSKCGASYNANSDACANRLLAEGKMNY